MFMIARLTNDEMEDVLRNNLFGHIGCNDGYSTYVYPINYVYDGRYIICHSQYGAKTAIMRQNKRVCFQVDEVKDFMNWKSILVLGEYHELEDERQRYDAMKVFLDKMLHIKISKPELQHIITEEQAKAHAKTTGKTIIFRISPEEVSGRFEREPA